MFAAQRKGHTTDLEAVEMLTRAGVHRAGTAVVKGVLAEPDTPARRVPCACGGEAHYYDQRSKQLLTAVGPVDFQRAYYVCPECQHGHSPRDRELDVQGTHFSPAVRRMMAVVGSQGSFQQGREQLELLAGLQVPAKAIERHSEAIGSDIAAREQTAMLRAKQLELPEVCAPSVPILYIEMDGTGVPIVKADLEHRQGKVEGQLAHTREVKLGCVFTQTTTDPEGRPVRDEDSTTYVAAIESAEAFGLRIYTEAWERGWSRAARKVIIADGAVWIWNLANQHFPGALQIVDLFHARQHLWELSAKLFPVDERSRKRWRARSLRLLDHGQIEALVKRLRAVRCAHSDLAKLIATDADYFQRNTERMRYPAFRKQGLFVGSGVVEAGCKTVIGARLKRSGMFWSVEGANAIIALRCCQLSSRFEDYWASRSRPA